MTSSKNLSRRTYTQDLDVGEEGVKRTVGSGGHSALALFDVMASRSASSLSRLRRLQSSTAIES